MVVLVASAQVKPNAGAAFAQEFEQKIVPSLQAQAGFKGEILLVLPGGPETILMTFWESHTNADGYERNVWPESVKLLSKVLDRPVLRRLQLAHSTLHPEGVAAFPPQSPITTEPTGVGA